MGPSGEQQVVLVSQPEPSQVAYCKLTHMACARWTVETRCVMGWPGWLWVPLVGHRVCWSLSFILQIEVWLADPHDLRSPD